MRAFSLPPCLPPPFRHTPQFSSSKYSYSLQPCSQSSHQVVQCEFDHEKMEYYNWNYLDQHIMGYDDFDMLSDVSVGDIRVSYGVYLCSVALLCVCVEEWAHTVW